MQEQKLGTKYMKDGLTVLENDRSKLVDGKMQIRKCKARKYTNIRDQMSDVFKTVRPCNDLYTRTLRS